MVGLTPTYSYSAANQQSNTPSYEFDPKAVTRASYISIPPSKPRDGPLINYVNYNKHPDSHVVAPFSSNTEFPPLSSWTLSAVTVSRRIQLCLRFLQTLAATGVLICFICFKGVMEVESWVLRIAAFWDMLISCYGVYHLLRPANGRTPTSQASYHFFCLFMDVCMIPFMVVVAYFSEKNWRLEPGTSGRWRSFFEPDYVATSKLLLASWIMGTVLGSLHLISIPINLYLGVIFRWISCYPDDMNPLDDDKIATVAASKHKYKNSKATLYSSEKQLAYLSGSTINISHTPGGNTTMSFDQSREPQYNSYGSHLPQPNRTGSVQHYPRSARPHSSHSRSPSRPGSYANSHRNSFVSTHDHARSRPMSLLSSDDPYYRYTSPQPGPQSSIAPTTARRHQKDALLNDNWQTYPSSGEETGVGEPSSPRRANGADQSGEDAGEEYDADAEKDLLSKPSRASKGHKAHDSAVMTDAGTFYFSDMPLSSGSSDKSSLKSRESLKDEAGASIGRALTVSSAVSPASSFYSPDISATTSRPASPRRKYYPDLTTAAAGVRGWEPKPAQDPTKQTIAQTHFYGEVGTGSAGNFLAPPPQSPRPGRMGKRSRAHGPPSRPQSQSPSPSPSRESSRDALAPRSDNVNDKPDEVVVGSMHIGMGIAQGRLTPASPSRSLTSSPHGLPRQDDSASRVWMHSGEQGRVVSRSGADIVDASVLYFGGSTADAPRVPKVPKMADDRVERMREVSGKVAEEGRATSNGGAWWALRRREVSGATAVAAA